MVRADRVVEAGFEIINMFELHTSDARWSNSGDPIDCNNIDMNNL